MNWKLKARVQSLVSKLPEPLNYRWYYNIQRAMGSLNKIDVPFELRKAKEFAELIQEQDHTVLGKTFMEIGTGRTANTEIGLWLCGANQLIAVDLNPYLKPELVIDSLIWLRKNKEQVEEILGDVLADRSLFDHRFAELQKVSADYDAVLNLINMKYLAPCDAADMKLDDQSIDYHISTNVLEHVPEPEIIRIFREARRLLRHDGLTVHRVDPSDHFAHSDTSITSINFLKFNEQEWNKLANNTFSYHNRMRTVDFYKLFDICGMRILSRLEHVDDRSFQALQCGFPIDVRFASYSQKELATTFFKFAAQFVTE